MGDIPTHPADGKFATFTAWVRHATSWIGGQNALCVDAKDRTCACGGDFMRARDDDSFPVRFYFGEGEQTPAQQRKSGQLAERRLRYY